MRYFIKLPLISILFLILIFNGCKKAQKNIIDAEKFPVSYTLKGKPVKEINFISKGNVNLMVIDTFLIIQREQEKFVFIYSTVNHKLLAKIGSKGRGPGEFITPELVEQISFDLHNESPILYIYDLTRRRVTHINLFDNIFEKCVNEQTILPDVNFYLTRLNYIDDSIFVGTPEDGGRFIFYNFNTHNFKMIPYIPKVNYKLTKPLPLVYRSVSCINPQKKLLASASVCLGQIDFFNFNGEHKFSTIFNSNDNLKIDLTNKENSFDPKYQIVDLLSKEDFIYGLNYNNCKGSELYAKDKPNFKVQVFDWDGMPIKEYNLDNHYVSSIAVDRLHNRIYGYCPNVEKNNLIIYNLPD